MTAIVILLFLVATLVSILFVRVVLSKPKKIVAGRSTEIPRIDADGIAARLSELIKKKTIASHDPGAWNPAEFEAFRELLPTLYPESHKVLERTIIGGHALLYRWKGKGEGEPLVLMSHYDVVPASDVGWIKPAFSGDIYEGKVWGRGTLDTKCTLAAALEAVESLIKSGYMPERDVYLSFGNDEEIGGDGTPGIVRYLTKAGVKPGLVLDEGGAVVTGVFPGVSKPLAMVGVAEKGVTDIELLVRSSGGHSSTPPHKGAAWRLARAITRLEARPFPAAFPPATRFMFRTLAPHASLGLRIILANLWFFEPLILWVFGRGGGELNAMCRTTVVVTMLEGSKAANVLPAEAKAVVNIRIAIGQSVESVIARIKRVINDPLVEIRVILPGEPSPVSALSGSRFDAVSSTVREVFPDAVTAPYIVLGGTDARHYANVSTTVYRFSPMTMSKAERASLHAVNEAIPISSMEKAVEFYIRLIRRAG